jgi:hypothetical protein
MEATVATPSPPLRASSAALLRDVAWRILVGLGAGAIAGLLVGGVGGRLAMLLLRLTSPESVIGMTSDDGFEIGVFSRQTLFLLQTTAGLGALAGAVYAVVRLTIPARMRLLLWTLFWAALGGTAIVHEDGVDFAALEPALLAILLFVAIAGGGAAAMALLVERWSARTVWRGRRFVALLYAAAAAGTIAVPLAAGLAAIVFAVRLALERAGRNGALVRRAALVVVPLAMVAATTVAAFALIRESARILD